jgi:hypothetical protein
MLPAYDVQLYSTGQRVQNQNGTAACKHVIHLVLKMKLLLLDHPESAKS